MSFEINVVDKTVILTTTVEVAPIGTAKICEREFLTRKLKKQLKFLPIEQQ